MRRRSRLCTYLKAVFIIIALKVLHVYLSNTSDKRQESAWEQRDARETERDPEVPRIPVILHEAEDTVLRNESQEERAEEKQRYEGPGERSRPVVVNREDLNEDERRRYDEGYEKYGYNVYLSDKMPLQRHLPDPRHPLCHDQRYDTRGLTCSVIIVFHNEAWSVLARTVHSVLAASPKHLLQEVLLVDDGSTDDALGACLEEYVSRWREVRVVRAGRRRGLIQARMLGAGEARGDVLVFMDAHCEARHGWLEPLLDPIRQNWTTVATPQIDPIDPDTFGVSTWSIGDDMSVGGMTWALMFQWRMLPKRVRRKSIVEPVPSATMAGGLFAISREYFQHLGMYDPGLDTWGGENMELSFKIWQCGGRLVQVPCAHVGHVYRKSAGARLWYDARADDDFLQRNLMRVAEVWLDEFKEIFYERTGYQQIELGDLSAQHALRRRLQCRHFRWYLDHVFPELFVPWDALQRGEIRNNDRGKCLDAGLVPEGQEMKAYRCHGQLGNQYWLLSAEGEMRRNDDCLTVSSGMKLIIRECHSQGGDQKWEYTGDLTLENKHFGHRCLQLSSTENTVILADCAPEDHCQKWTWETNDRHVKDVKRGQVTAYALYDDVI